MARLRGAARRLHAHGAAFWIPVTGMAIRLALVLGTHRPIKGPHDQLVYWSAGENIGKGFGYHILTWHRTAYYPPGYPYFLGVLQGGARALGVMHSLPLVGGLAQVVLAGVMIWAVMRVARHMVTSAHAARTAAVAGAIVALWPNLIAYTAVLLSEQLYITLMCCTAAGLCEVISREQGRMRTRWLWFTALCFAGSVLVRPQALLLPVFLVVTFTILRRPWRDTIRVIGALAIAVVIVLTPWTIRNYTLFHRFVPLSTNSGDNLCLGFNPDSEGHFAIVPPCETVPFYRAGVEEEYHRNEVNTKIAFDWARSHVGELPALTVKKFRWTYEHDYDGLRALEDYGSDEWIPSALRSSLRVIFNLYLVVVMTFAAGGIVLSIRQLRRQDERRRTMAALLLAVTVANFIVPALFFGETRFKVPVLPFYAVLAAVAINALRSRKETSHAAS